MTFKDIKNRLGYKTNKDMFMTYEYSESNISRIKKDNPDRYELIKYEIILKHNNINTEQLINMIETYNRLKGEV